jgi:uncharacterized protein
MELIEVDFEDATPIDGYGPAFFRIGGEIREGAVLLLPRGLRSWGGYGDRERILAQADEIDVLLVGTGPQMAYLPAEFRTALDAAGIGVEAMASAQACRTYNVLLGEGRRVGAALLPAG